jgi:hypothetical protein
MSHFGFEIWAPAIERHLESDFANLDTTWALQATMDAV